MLEAIIALIIAAVSSLGFLAYRHPIRFATLAWELQVVSGFVFAFLAGWELASVWAARKVIRVSGSREAQEVVQSIALPFPEFYVGFLLWLIYLFFLRKLPDLGLVSNVPADEDKE